MRQERSGTKPDPQSRQQWLQMLEEYRRQESELQQGGGADNIKKQHAKNRMTARERIAQLIDPGSEFFELALFAAFDMYQEWGARRLPGWSPASGASRIVCS